MIGVIAEAAEQETVREFFELFKTPWEFYQAGRRYDTLLCAGERPFNEPAKVVLVYAGRKLRADGSHKIETPCQSVRVRAVSREGSRIPIYGEAVTFPEKTNGSLTEEESGLCLAYVEQSGERVVARIGYDLFGEVRALLTAGQPSANASIPALELHISFLRDLITGSGVSLAEIPPVPDGYSFIACLTHDIDHPSIRHHKWDHTMFGFVYRAVFGSLRDTIQRRRPLAHLIANWAAVLRLPFVYMGLAKDSWREFDDRYLELEKGVCSTFFAIPFKGRAGKRLSGKANGLRAASYGACDIAEALRKVMAAGCEIGLHGIDAWAGSASGREELEEIRRLTGLSEIGVRMHWLYFDRGSHVALEDAGANYDSTIGYNETVGYRAGTTQAFKPFEVKRLLELPLHVMDTALFYPSYLGLSPFEAKTVLSRMADNAVRFGGCLTINWHDRSVAPERLWDASYRDLLQDLKSRGAWLATAGQAVAWFRKRRSAVFTGCDEPERVRVTADGGDDLPGLGLRIHKARGSTA